MTIIRSRVPFSDDFIPPNVVDREEEQAILKRHLEPITKGDIQPVGLHIIGSIGTGKTVTTRVVMENMPIQPCYMKIDRWVKAKAYRMASDLAAFFGLKAYEDLTGIFSKIEKYAKGKPFIVVIDEADVIPPLELDSIISFLSRHTYATTFVISRRPDVIYNLGKDTQDSFKYREFVFPAYNTDALFKILKQRADMGLDPKSYNDELLWAVARVVEPSGSARYALDLLLATAETAERWRYEVIEQKLIESAIEDVEKNATKYTYQGMPLQHNLC